MDDEYDDAPDDEESESSDEKTSEFKQAAEEAFPDETWDEARLAAFKDLIHQCIDEGYSDKDDKGKSKPGPLAVLAFGKPSKK